MMWISRRLEMECIKDTCSGNQTPGWVAPSRSAMAKAEVAFPTDLSGEILGNDAQAAE